MLALIELDDESRVGNPVVTARQHVASHERADAVSPISLQNPCYVPQYWINRSSRVCGEVGLPSESVVAHACPIDAPEKLPDTDLALATPLGVALGGGRCGSRCPRSRTRRGRNPAAGETHWIPNLQRIDPGSATPPWRPDGPPQSCTSEAGARPSSSSSSLAPFFAVAPRHG